MISSSTDSLLTHPHTHLQASSFKPACGSPPASRYSWLLSRRAIIFCFVRFNETFLVQQEAPAGASWTHLVMSYLEDFSGHNLFLIVQVQTASWVCTCSLLECTMWSSAGSTIKTPWSGWRAWNVAPLDFWPCSLQRYFNFYRLTNVYKSTHIIIDILNCKS